MDRALISINSKGKKCMNEKEQAVRSIPLFEQLDASQRELLARAANMEHIPKGGLYFSEQAAAKGLHVLVSGRVKLFKVSDDGKEQTIYLFGPGEPFCLCSLFSDGQMPANLAALEASRVLVIAPDRFERLAAEAPSLLLAILRVMAHRLKEAMNMIDALALKQIPSRVALVFPDARAGWAGAPGHYAPGVFQGHGRNARGIVAVAQTHGRIRADPAAG